MFYIAVDKTLDSLINQIENILKDNNIEILSKEEKNSGTLSAKAVVLTLRYKNKIFKMSIVSWKDKATVSLVFPKKEFSEEEKRFLKNLLEKLKDESS